jgi:hypothetical protein
MDVLPMKPKVGVELKIKRDWGLSLGVRPSGRDNQGSTANR